MLLGILVVAASVLLGIKVVGDARRSGHAVAVTRDLAAGSVLTADDLRVVDATVPDGAPYLSEVGSAVGKALNRPLGSGELLPASAVGRPPAHTVITVPLGPDTAPPLDSGERIEIWLSTKTCPSVVLLADVPVQDVRPPSSGAFGANGGQDVVLDVAPQQADRVVTALALEGATLRAGVLSGPPRTAPDLPPIDGCAGS
jgi:SAF domain